MAGDVVDCLLGNCYQRTVAGNTTFSFVNVPVADAAYSLRLDVVHSGGVIAWPASVRWPGGMAPVLTTGRTRMFFFSTTGRSAHSVGWRPLLPQQCRRPVMYYLHAESGDCPLTPNQVMACHPECSFPVPLEAPDGYEAVAATEPPVHDRVTHGAIEGAPRLEHGARVQSWSIVALTSDEIAARAAARSDAFLQARADKVAAINVQYERRMAAIADGYPVSERESWPVQTREAHALLADAAAKTPWIDAAAAARAIDRAELARRIAALDLALPRGPWRVIRHAAAAGRHGPGRGRCHCASGDRRSCRVALPGAPA